MRDWARATADSTPLWDPMREALTFGPCKRADLPWRTQTGGAFAGPKRRVRPADAGIAGVPWIHFAANSSHGYRLFTHWYTFLLFDDGPTDAYYKRFVRDNLRYKDDVVCAAGRIARALAGKSARSRGVASYSAAHVSVGINHWSTAGPGYLQTPQPRSNRTRFP